VISLSSRRLSRHWWMVSGCSQPQAAPPAAAAAPAAPAKIPVTTASEDARKEYLEGRSLVERLLIQDSIAHFDKAIAADSQLRARRARPRELVADRDRSSSIT
jgi:hypothetical protein